VSACLQIVLPGRSEPLIPHSLPADDAHLLKNPQILEIHSLPYDIAHLLEIHNQPFSTFVPSPLNQNIFLEDMLKKKHIFASYHIRKQLLVFPNSKLADGRTAKGKSISLALTIHPDPR